MSGSYLKKIKLLGFEPVQRAIVASLATLSRNRQIQYRITTEDDIFAADVLLIDVHDDVVVENWRQLREIVGDVPVVAVGEDTIVGATSWVKRSLLASSLLDTLDVVVARRTANNDDYDSSQSQSSFPKTAQQSISDGNRFAQVSRSYIDKDERLASNDPHATSTRQESGVDQHDRYRVTESRTSRESNSVLLLSDVDSSNESVASEPDRSPDSAPVVYESDDKLLIDDVRDNGESTLERLDDELIAASKSIRASSNRPNSGENAGVVIDNEPPGSVAEAEVDDEEADASIHEGTSLQLGREPSFAKSRQTPHAPTSLNRQDQRPVTNSVTAKSGPNQEPESTPAAETSARGNGSYPKSVVPAGEEKYKNRFLVVDDSPYVWTQLKICLSDIPVDVDFVSTAEDGLDEVRNRVYDLIFLDVMLPYMNGYDACKRIKKDKASRRVPVIMLTGKSTPANKMKGMLSGCNYYLTKPVSELEVRAVVDRYFTKLLKKSA